MELVFVALGKPLFAMELVNGKLKQVFSRLKKYNRAGKTLVRDEINLVRGKIN